MRRKLPQVPLHNANEIRCSKSNRRFVANLLRAEVMSYLIENIASCLFSNLPSKWACVNDARLSGKNFGVQAL